MLFRSEKEYGKALRLFESGICLNRHLIDVSERTPKEAAEFVCDMVFRDPDFAELLKRKMLRKTKCGTVWWKTSDYHYKFFLTDVARDELKEAVQVMELMKLSKGIDFVPSYEVLNGNLMISRLYSLFPEARRGEIGHLAATMRGAPGVKKSLWDVLNGDRLLDFFVNNAQILTCRDSLSTIMVESSFAHRDFHEANIVYSTEDGVFKIIDWGDGKVDSVWAFDLYSICFYREVTLRAVSIVEVYKRFLADGVKSLSPQNEYGILLVEHGLENVGPFYSAYLLDCITVALGKRTSWEAESKRKKLGIFLNTAVAACGIEDHV